MKVYNKILYVLFLSLGLGSCEDFSTDLDVPNLNSPSDEILLTDAVALEASAGGIINAWFQMTQDNLGPASSLAVMSDAFSCSWGNYGMRDTSEEPRVAWNNGSGYGNAYVTENYFNAMHSILADSNNLIKALDNGIEFGEDGVDNARIESIGRFGQALATGYLALVFDRVWLSDETGSLNEGEAVDYMIAMDQAIMFLDQAISVTDANSFEIPTDWVPGLNLNSSTLSEFMNSIGARMLTMNSRNSTQRDATDWEKVLDYANNGITYDFAPLMDDVVWYTDLKWTVAYPGWGRVDMYVVNQMDPSTPAEWPAGQVTLPESTSDDARLLSDFEYLTSQDFIPSRGEYHYSTYRYKRWDEYISLWTVPAVEMLQAENDLYKAEAHLRMGNASDAADVINAGSRVTRGELEPVGTSASDVEAALHYERLVELMNSSMGITFFEMRKENLLQQGTMLHFPIPGSVLATVGIPEYTFGGSDGVPGEDVSNGGWK